LIPGVTGVILAGGASSRMKSNKALLPVSGGRFIEVIHRQMRALFSEVLLVTNTPEQYAFLGSPMVPDRFPGQGPLAGIHAALLAARTPRIMVVACDMPHLNEPLIRHLATLPTLADVVIPESEHGLEPLHALYATSCLPAIASTLTAGRKRIVSFFDDVQVARVPFAEITAIDPAGQGFLNINTPEEYFQLRQRGAVPPLQEPLPRQMHA
jgi:FdhD protein